MELSIDMRVAELLASRLCHDIVGPIGAVCNGLELLEDDEFGMAEDATKLANNSARQAADSLQFFRLAYGMAGSRVGGVFTEIRDIAAAHLGHGKVEMDWSGEAPADPPDGLGKLILNLLELGVESLPRGGSVAVNCTGSGPNVSLDVTLEGQDAGLREDAADALADTTQVDDLTPRNVHAYFTRLLARRLGGDLAVESGEGRCVLKVLLGA